MESYCVSRAASRTRSRGAAEKRVGDHALLKRQACFYFAESNQLPEWRVGTPGATRIGFAKLARRRVACLTGSHISVARLAERTTVAGACRRRRMILVRGVERCRVR